MTILALSWPTAFLASVIVAVVGLFLTVATWQVLETGRTGIREERHRR